MIDPHGIPETETFVTHLECGYEGDRYEADTIQNLSKAGKPLLVRYDLEGVKKALTKDVLASRAATMWRYRELLPVRRKENITTLGEIMTPLVRLPAVEKSNGASAPIIVKDEGRLPTGSFKARGLAMAVAMAKELGLQHLAMPTNGNAGAAMAAYCRRGGMEAYIFCPEDTPDINVREIQLQGAKVWKVNGYIDDCGKIVGEGKGPMGWFDTSTLKEPYRIEGKKTMGLELAEQLGWQVPDVILYPTGGGTGLIGMWKAFNELEAIGLIGSKRPRIATGGRAIAIGAGRTVLTSRGGSARKVADARGAIAAVATNGTRVAVFERITRRVTKGKRTTSVRSTAVRIAGRVR